MRGGRWSCEGQEGWETGSGVKCEEREGSEGVRLRGSIVFLRRLIQTLAIVQPQGTSVFHWQGEPGGGRPEMIWNPLLLPYPSLASADRSCSSVTPSVQ